MIKNVKIIKIIFKINYFNFNRIKLTIQNYISDNTVNKRRSTTVGLFYYWQKNFFFDRFTLPKNEQ